MSREWHDSGLNLELFCMKVTIEHLGRKYLTDLEKGIDLSSTLGKAEHELRAWNVPLVKKEPVRAGEWTGSVKSGAAVNFYNIHFNPHGNGTHTESYGHISSGWESVNDQVKSFHFLAYLVHMEPELINGDKIVRPDRLKEKIKKWNFEALIIKTGDYKRNENFSQSNPAYLSSDLIKFIKEMGVMHLLIDLPSVDREEDGGKLASHKAFWDFPDNPRRGATITELLHIPADTREGLYLLNLQIAPFHNDASPSRPVVYPVESLPGEGIL